MLSRHRLPWQYILITWPRTFYYHSSVAVIATGTCWPDGEFWVVCARDFLSGIAFSFGKDYLHKNEIENLAIYWMTHVRIIDLI